uniref:PH domain-containing protein n=1 Tax=Globisporangium ultimum (strain ATCC 200006 / CBS 805.95 / DAOM BR144) TaxID=431595 RepID=K3XAJ7_GLOUD
MDARHAEAVVAQLLRVHLGFNENDESAAGGDAYAAQQPVTPDNVRSFRELFMLPFAHSLQGKRELLHAAESTGCTGVIMDVLLFLSQTMAPSVFTTELVKTPLALSQWIHYMSEKCVVDNEDVSLQALHGILELYSITKRFDDLATLLASLVFKERRIENSLRVAVEVASIARHYRHRFPAWILELINEHIALSELQIATERRDACTAPDVCIKDGYMDKRARGVASIKANWRMRYFQLGANELSYSKHDADRLATSKNPFLDKRKKGSVTLTQGLSVTPLDYVGKLSKRPYCIQIGEGHHALIIDPCTPVVQQEWMAAIAANIKRLEMDPKWLQFPRRCVHRMTQAEFLRYCLLYHSTGSGGDPSVHPQALRERFQIDEKRYYYSLLQTMALRGDWDQFDAHTRPSKTGISMFSSSNSNSKYTSSTFDPSCIGYGAILDVALRGRAPGNLVVNFEAMLQKHEAKSAAKPAWSCRTNGDESASLSIRIAIPDSIRAEAVGY